MYRLMIIDDDRLIREHLREIIESEEPGLTVCAEAQEGEEALELFRQHKPHLVITDINIPLINGLDVARQIKSESRDTDIIIVTGYGTLEHAREAISACASAFILKPISREELVGAVRQSLSQLEQKRLERQSSQKLERLLSESLPLLRERFLQNLVSGTAGQEEGALKARLMRLGLELPPGPCCAAVLMPSYGDIEPQDREMAQIALQNITQEILGQQGIDCLIFFDALLCAVAVAWSGKPGLTVRLEAALSQVRDRLRFYFNIDIAAGVGRMAEGLPQLPGSYRTAVEAVRYKNIFGENNVVNIENVYLLEEPERPSLRDDAEGVINAFKSGDREGTEAAVKRLVGQAAAGSAGSPEPLKRALIELLARLFTYCEQLGLPTQSLFQEEPYYSVLMTHDILRLQRLMLSICDRLLSELAKKRSSRSCRLVENAKQIILERLGDSELSLSAVCGSLGLSEAYFCQLFKNETGMSFIEYLNHTRVERAKELLRDTRLKIYEVAERVGYANPKYFYHIFKKLTGRRPREYSEHERPPGRVQNI